MESVLRLILGIKPDTIVHTIAKLTTCFSDENVKINLIHINGGIANDTLDEKITKTSVEFEGYFHPALKSTENIQNR